MTKYKLFFRLSFITYILLMLAMPYITAQMWADTILLFFIVSLIYQVIYMFILRKKDDEKLTKVFLIFILYAITSISIYIIIGYVNDFINGFTPTDFLGNRTGDTYYGIQAILKNDWKNSFCVPYMIINLLIIIIYKLIVKKVRK